MKNFLKTCKCSFQVAEIIMISFSSSRWVIYNTINIYIYYNLYTHISRIIRQYQTYVVKTVSGDFLRSRLVDLLLATTNHVWRPSSSPTRRRTTKARIILSNPPTRCNAYSPLFHQRILRIRSLSFRGVQGRCCLCGVQVKWNGWDTQGSSRWIVERESIQCVPMINGNTM